MTVTATPPRMAFGPPRPGAAGPPAPARSPSAPGAEAPASLAASADAAAAPAAGETGPAVAPPGAQEASVDDVLAATAVIAVLERLDAELVALAPVKQRIREIAALLVIDRLRAQVGLASERPSLHMSFTGNPGTGKTTVALRMAEILHRLGYLESGHLVTVTRDDLVGQYVGHTAPKTKEALARASGGVLFIDEAYYLHRPESERDYGQEAIEILLQVMESERDRLVVIFAGYADRMDDFFRSNPGMGSRVAHHIDFPDYSDDELLAIAGMMLGAAGYRLAADAEPTLREYVARRREQPRFANARSIRNAIDRARLRQAGRLFDRGGVLHRSDLETIEQADLLASRVMGAAPPDPDPIASKEE